jgi:predicted alpha/beta-hydrolase family hydrolase
VNAAILAHGAANDMHNPLITKVAQGLAAAGWLTLRFNFLYREKNRRSPDHQTTLEQTWASAWRFVDQDLDWEIKQIAAIGKSMGGRVASQMVAQNKLSPTHLVFLGYPLHAPGKNENARGRHLPQIFTPMLFFAGTRDPFANLDLLKSVVGQLKSYDLEIIEGGDHSFNLPQSAKISRERIYQNISDKTVAWLNQDLPTADSR